MEVGKLKQTNNNGNKSNAKRGGGEESDSNSGF